eukprot:234800_1
MSQQEYKKDAFGFMNDNAYVNSLPSPHHQKIPANYYEDIIKKHALGGYDENQQKQLEKQRPKDDFKNTEALDVYQELSLYIGDYETDNNKAKGLKDSEVMAAIQCMAKICSPFDHNNFKVLHYFHIHGGTPRDLITGKPIKDIDLIIDIHGLQSHARNCQSKQCLLSKHLRSNINEYYRIMKIENEQQRNNEYIISDKVINGRLFFNYFKQQTTSKNSFIKSTTGPIKRGANLFLYQMVFDNGIDFDLVDCTYYGTSDRRRSTYWTHQVLALDFIYEVTYEDHCKRVDATINALSIHLSDIIGVSMKKWINYIYDPFGKERQFTAVSDIKNRIIRAYGNYLYSLAKTEKGQGEMIIYRTIKNCTKFKGGGPIYLSKKMRTSGNNYKEWFNTDMIKKQEYQRVIRHIFGHNYYKKQGVTEDLVLSVFHAFWYDGAIFAMYKHNELFRLEINV